MFCYCENLIWYKYFKVFIIFNGKKLDYKIVEIVFFFINCFISVKYDVKILW